MPAPGCVVAFWEGAGLALGVVAGEEKQRVRLILDGGREERVAPARIAFEIEPGHPPGTTPEARREAGRRAAAAAARISALSTSVDVALLWELAIETGEVQDDRVLADLALGAATVERRAAVTFSLLADGVRFVRKGSGWEPRSREAVLGIQLERERTAEREAGRRAAIEAFRRAAAGEGFHPTGGPEQRRYLKALEDLAVLDLDATEAARSLAIEALDGAGVRYDRPNEGAFRLLRRTGRFASDDENLAVVRHGLRTEFPEEVRTEAAGVAKRGAPREARADLTGIETVTVDGPTTREIDDALSLEANPGGGWRIGIHIADPSAFVALGGAVDAEALARAVTHYLPDMRLPMLPEEISEAAASLVAGEERPALSFLVDLDASAEIARFEILRSRIRSRARLTYDGADRAIETGEGPFAGLLAELARIADLREARRAAAGAVRIFMPEVDVRVGADGRVALERSDPGSPAHRLVAEAMILAGEVGARFCSERGLPAVYRRQAPPEKTLPRLEGTEVDYVLARALRRSLRRGEVSLQPGWHAALGLPAYAQVTSPLRRYQDLAVHRQLVRAIAGEPPTYDAEALQRVAATTEAAEGDGRRAERACERYWLLRYIEQRGGEPLEAIVVETVPRPVALLLETLIEEPVPGLAGVSPGERLVLRAERVNPRADLLVLREA